jgi:hypothetical protein
MDDLFAWALLAAPLVIGYGGGTSIIGSESEAAY